MTSGAPSARSAPASRAAWCWAMGPARATRRRPGCWRPARATCRRSRSALASWLPLRSSMPWPTARSTRGSCAAHRRATGSRPASCAREAQGVLVRRDHELAAGASVALVQLGDCQLLLHPREANPGHYDAVLALCHGAGVEPRVLERNPALDLAQTPIVEGRRGRDRRRVLAHRSRPRARRGCRCARRRRSRLRSSRARTAARPRSIACSPRPPRSPPSWAGWTVMPRRPEHMPKPSFPSPRRAPSLAACQR